MPSEPRQRGSSGLRLSWWNLILLVPLLVLVTPIYNTDAPRLIGLPYFYWYQLLFVFVGVLCVWIVYLATRDRKRGPTPSATPPTTATDPSTDDTTPNNGSEAAQ